MEMGRTVGTILLPSPSIRCGACGERECYCRSSIALSPLKSARFEKQSHITLLELTVEWLARAPKTLCSLFNIRPQSDSQ